MTIEGKQRTDFVASACGAEEAFVQKEFFSDESGETRLKAHPGLEPSKVLPVPLAACQRDMRVKGTRFRDESAKLRSCGDTFMEQEQFGGNGDADKEYPWTIEDAQSLKPYWNGRQTHLAQSRHCTLALFLAGVTEKLESNVPGFGRRPSNPVPVGSEPDRYRRKFGDYHNRQGYSGKQAHTKVMVRRGMFL